jgi:hypothetical protein
MKIVPYMVNNKDWGTGLAITNTVNVKTFVTVTVRDVTGRTLVEKEVDVGPFGIEAFDIGQFTGLKLTDRGSALVGGNDILVTCILIRKGGGEICALPVYEV